MKPKTKKFLFVPVPFGVFRIIDLKEINLDNILIFADLNFLKILLINELAKKSGETMSPGFINYRQMKKTAVNKCLVRLFLLMKRSISRRFEQPVQYVVGTGCTPQLIQP